MKTFVFAAIKGGVGKSSLAILTANALAANAKKVLVIDLDPQNSATFYYQPEEVELRQSVANVLNGGRIEDNIISNGGYVDLLPSSLELLTARECDVMALSNALRTLKGYDYVVIDTAPTLDNVVINALNAADNIITPVQFGVFDFKTAVFYESLMLDMGLISKWRVLFNKFKPIKQGEGNKMTLQYSYNQAFKKYVLKSRVPEASVLKRYFDYGDKISKASQKLKVYEAINLLCEELTGKKLEAEVF